jgi:hypothetical protein
MELLDRLAPVTLPRQVIPLGNPVPQRAAVVAERDSAVHATSGLPLYLGDVLLLVDLTPVHQPDRDRTALGQFAFTG